MFKDNISILRNATGFSQEEVAIGMVTMNEKGQIVIPKKAREVMGYGSSEELLVLGDEESGIALMKARDFEKQMHDALKAIQ